MGGWVGGWVMWEGEGTRGVSISKIQDKCLPRHVQYRYREMVCSGVPQ